MADPFDVLGIPQDSDSAEVAAAYKQRAQILHPDRLEGSPEAVRLQAKAMMQDLNRAREEALRIIGESKAATEEASSSSSTREETAEAASSRTSGAADGVRQFELRNGRRQELVAGLGGRLPAKVRVKLSGPPIGPGGVPVTSSIVLEVISQLSTELPRGGRLLFDRDGVWRLADDRRVLWFV